MTANEALELTNRRGTTMGLKVAALEAIRQNAEKGLRAASLFVPNIELVSDLESMLQQLGYKTETLHDMVVIKW